MKDFVPLCGRFGKRSGCIYSNVNSCVVGCIALCVTWLNVLTIFLYIYCILCFLYVWSECYWKRYSKNPPFWMWFCLFLFILSSIFQSYVLLPLLNFDVCMFIKGAPHYDHEDCLFNSISVQFSCSVVSDSLWLHGLQHARLPCPSPNPEFTQTHVHWASDSIQ